MSKYTKSEFPADIFLKEGTYLFYSRLVDQETS